MQRPIHPSLGRVKQNVDGCLFVRMGLDGFFFNSYVSWSPVRRTAQSALHVVLLSSYIGNAACVYFMSINATFAVAARNRKVSRRPCTCPTTGNILIRCIKHCFRVFQFCLVAS